jgi:hypothetical protein
MQLGDSGYSELWAFADLGGNKYATHRETPAGNEDVWVSALVIAHQRSKDGSQGAFLIVELDEDAGVIDDWFENNFEQAKTRGAVMAGRERDGLEWEAVPDTTDLRASIRARLRSAR